MNKLEKEYIEKYDDISNDYDTRIELLKSNLKTEKQINLFESNVKSQKKLKWREVDITIYLEPKPTPRPRLGRNGIFYVKGSYDNKRIFEKYYGNIKDVGMIMTPCKFKCTTYIPTPKSMNKVEKLMAEMGLIYPLSKPDWDNLAKTYCDMIQGTLIYDDSIIIEGTLKKRYSIKPRIEINIKFLDDFDSQYNKKKFLKKGLI